MAVATGIAEGLGLGFNARAALITRGLAEMTRLGLQLGRRASDVRWTRRTGRSGAHVHGIAQPQPQRWRRGREGSVARRSSRGQGDCRRRSRHDAERARACRAGGSRDADCRCRAPRAVRGSASARRHRRADDARASSGDRTDDADEPVQEFFSIGDVCTLTDLKPHVLRYWESQFRFLHPAKNRSGNRVYQRREIELIMLVKHLLYTEKYTIDGARQKIDEYRKSGELRTVARAALDSQTVESMEATWKRYSRQLTESRKRNDRASRSHRAGVQRGENRVARREGSSGSSAERADHWSQRWISGWNRGAAALHLRRRDRLSGEPRKGSCASSRVRRGARDGCPRGSHHRFRRPARSCVRSVDSRGTR